MAQLHLEDVCTAGSSNIAQKDLDKRNGVYPIYGAGGFIKNVDFYKQKKSYIAIVKDGAGVGRITKLPAESSIIGTMQYIIPKENIDIDYLAFALEQMNLGKYCTGATIPHIYYKDYCKEKLPLHDLEEQKKIAGILSKTTNTIVLRKQQLSKLDELVKSQFIEMFGEPVTNPKKWPEKHLGELGELNRGISKNRPRNAPELLDGPYPLIQTGEVSNTGLYITNYTSTYSEAGLAQSKMWPKGTLCITIAANIAQTAILAIDACFPDSVVGFISNEQVENIYAHYWFGFFQKILEEQATQVAQKNINLKILNNLDVMVPPKELQNQFVLLVQQVDKSKFEIQKSLDNLETLKKALMQQYFG